MKLLIIGSKGFIGSNLCDFYGARENIELWQCDVVPDNNKNINYSLIDANNPNFDFLFKKNNYDVCINTSGSSHVGFSLTNPALDFTLNSFNVCKILDAIRKYNSDCKFINISSAAVYGNPKELPITETHFITPLSPYGFHKIVAEQLCKEYNLFYGIKTLSLRVFSVYGNGIRKQLFWDIYQKSKEDNDAIELFGTGMETRDFIYIDDLIRAIDISILKNPFNGEPINVASGIESTIKEVANKFINYIECNKKINFNNEIKKGDPLYWKADISKLKSYGFVPEVNIQEGLLKYSKWLKESLL